MFQEMAYYNRMHVKTRLSQSILSNIVVHKPITWTAWRALYYNAHRCAGMIFLGGGG
jgi:hypothetical protein